MELITKEKIEILLNKYNTKPNKSLGQNFLINKDILSCIISSANLSKEDTVIEVGPGLGTLTVELSKNAKKIIAIEKDKKMVEILEETTKGCNNVKLINKDALIYKTEEKKYKMISNLPYYVASQIIKKFLNCENPPLFILAMVQKEVAERLTATPPKMNMLAVIVQSQSNIEIVRNVGKGCFWPPPNIDSSIVKITPHKKEKQNLFYDIVKAGFSHPRKQLLKNIIQFDNKALKELQLNRNKVILAMQNCDIKIDRRAESLSIKEWNDLTRQLTKND